MREDVTVFGTPALTGVMCRPDDQMPSELPGVILVSPGLVHRVGSNRVYVKLARALAEDGFTVLRFDLSGVGDSPRRSDNLPLHESAVEEVRMAIDHIIGCVGCSQVLLLGHCGGGIFGLMSAFSDERIAGIIVINPEGGDDAWVEFDRRKKEARYYANYYSRGALSDAGRWKRLLTGKAAYRSIARNVFRNIIWYRLSTLAFRIRSASGLTADAASERFEVQEFKIGLRSLSERKLPILFIHPDQAAGPELIRAVLGTTIEEMRASGNLKVKFIQNSDHGFTPLAAQRDLIAMAREWMVEHGKAYAMASTSESASDTEGTDGHSAIEADQIGRYRATAAG